jgi:LysR family nod box-dependent transcriptional activator
MRLNGLDLNLLVALDALLAEKKVVAAARRLSTSQSAVSGMLARLRVHYGDALLVQTGRTMALTALGHDLAEPVRQLLLQIQATVSQRPTLAIATERRRFRITVSDYATALLAGPLMQRLETLAPFIEIELRPQIENAPQSLRNGETDLLIMPDMFLDPGQPHAPLFEDTFSCVVWDGNTEVGATLDLDTFLRCRHATVRLGHPSVAPVSEGYFEEHDIARRIGITTHDFTSLMPIIVGTQLIATIQTRLAKDNRSCLPVRILPAPVPIPALRICMQWHRYQETDPSHVWLRNQFVEIARDLGPLS